MESYYEQKKQNFITFTLQAITYTTNNVKRFIQVDNVRYSYPSFDLLQRSYYGVTYSYKFTESSRTCALTFNGKETMWDAELGYLRTWDSTRYVNFFA